MKLIYTQTLGDGIRTERTQLRNKSIAYFHVSVNLGCVTFSLVLLFFCIITIIHQRVLENLRENFHFIIRLNIDSFFTSVMSSCRWSHLFRDEK